MTLALRRFHLDGIGPAGARFDPLTVVLDSADDDRAAETAVLFLENGGGKSVLLRLLFSVVLPGRRYTVGSVKLDGYVGSGDTGHVVLQWDTPDGPLVTGTLLEWRNRTRSASSSNLMQLWYSFRPKPGMLSLDGLPMREEGRRVSRAGFRERLSLLAREHPELELVVEDSPGRWAEHLLRSTPIDPEIFRYQRQMNADEADAESLFAGLKTDEDFVRFVVEAVLDPEQAEGFHDLLVDYAGALGKREEREVEQRFCAEGADALRPLAKAEATLAVARAEEAAAVRGAQRLRDELVAGVAQARDDALLAQKEAEAHGARAQELTTEARRLQDTVSELRLREAQFNKRAAQAALEEAQAEQEAASLLASGWEHVGLLLDLRGLQAQLDELRISQERQDKELAPLRRAAGTAARRYALRLDEEAESLEREALAAEATAQNGAEAAARHSTDQADRQQEAGEALGLAKAHSEQAEQVDKDIAGARADGLVGADEAVDDALRQAEKARDEATASLQALRSRRSLADGKRAGLRTALHETERDHALASAKLGSLREQLNDLQGAGEAIISHPRAQEIAPDATDVWLVLERLEQVLDQAVREGESRERLLRDQADAVERQVEGLDAEGLLPAAPDVRRVRDAIVEAGIGAATGWTYLDQNLDQDGQADALATNPGLAGGVVVTDPSKLDAALEALRAAEVQTSSVVLVGSADDLRTPGGGSAAPLREALYDRNLVGQVREELEAERLNHQEESETVAARLGVDGPLLSEVRQLVHRCSPAQRDELVKKVADLEAEVTGLKTVIATRQEGLQALDEELGALAEAEPGLVAQAEQAAEAARRLARLQDDEARASRLRQDAEAAQAQAVRLADDARRLGELAEKARRGAEDARADARRARSDATARRTQAQQLLADTAREPGGGGEDESVRTEPPGVDVTTEALRGAYEAAKAAYESQREGRDLTRQIERVEDDLRGRSRQIASLDPFIVRQAEALAAEPGAHHEDSRRERHAAAREAATRARAEVSRQNREVGAADAVLKQRRPRGKARHAELRPEDEPSGAEDAALSAVEHERRARSTKTQAEKLDRAADDCRRQASDKEQRAGLLTATVGSLPTVPEPGRDSESRPEPGSDADRDAGAGEEPPAAPWMGSTAEATDQAQAARERHDRATEALAAAQRELERAGSRVRQVANDPSLAGMGGLRLSLAHEPLDHLAARAASLADELDAMRQSVEEELKDLYRHREGIVQRLATLVEAQLRQLKQLIRLSELPQGLGEWSGKPFVSVNFQAVSAGELTARLGPLVDEAAAEPKKRKVLDLLLAGMRAAVLHRQGDTERTFSVRLLRPNRMMTLQRASVAELEKEFSGGMKLTAAICTYCALAALRANTRSTGSLFGLDPGPLFLDNPLGKASADYLLDLQHAIAGKLGVQLVHTTGVYDVEALATYERVVRLRNLADLRRNVNRLRVDDDVRLSGSGASIDAVALTVRRPTSQPAPKDAKEIATETTRMPNQRAFDAVSVVTRSLGAGSGSDDG